jgi:hypothetical protein
MAIIAVLTAVAATVAAAAPAAQAGETRTVTVANDGPAKFWTGVSRADGAPRPEVPECAAVHCDMTTLRVSLPRNIWRRPGGVQVAIRWDGATEAALSLFVYKGSTLVAKSTAAVGMAQSVLIPRAGNGVYRVYVAYGITFGAVDPDPVVAYDGLAEVEYDPPVRPVRDLLPDLAALPQENITYDNPGTIFDDTAQPGQSCFDSERAEHGARQCLRFDQVLRNRGNGPVEIRFDRQTGVFQDEHAVQRIYRSDGTSYDVPTGQVEFHPVHNHYHFKGFAQSDLWLLDDDGNLVGTEPAAIGEKVSFCIADTDLVGWGEKGDAAMGYPAPDCLDPKQVVGTTEYFWYGMSRGWADRYNWFLPDQMIDTYGLADGTYALFTTVDPESKLREADETNNCGSVLVELSGLATATPQAALLGTGPACP